jgi:hypothetical protein
LAKRSKRSFGQLSTGGVVDDGNADKTARSHGVLDAVIEIGQQRARIVEAMKEALLRGDDAEALERARELTGLPSKRSTDSAQEESDESRT